MEANHTGPEPRSTTMASKAFRIVGHMLAGIGFAVIFALVFALLVRFIWNSLMPAVFGLGVITYWQAFEMTILAKLLFGGFGTRRQDRRRKDSNMSSYRHWSSDEFDEQAPPERFDRNWKAYNQYWRKEGKAAFEAYLDQTEKQ